MKPTSHAANQVLNPTKMLEFDPLYPSTSSKSHITNPEASSILLLVESFMKALIIISIDMKELRVPDETLLQIAQLMLLMIVISLIFHFFTFIEMES